jgi:hypothetical protein
MVDSLPKSQFQRQLATSFKTIVCQRSVVVYFNFCVKTSICIYYFRITNKLAILLAKLQVIEASKLIHCSLGENATIAGWDEK